MKMWKKMLTSVFTASVLFCLSVMSVFAAPEKEYDYQVTFYAGNQGSFSGTAGLSVKGSGYSIHAGNDKITVSGLKQGDVVSFDVQAGTVVLEEDSKYYVKGVRLSGRDNNVVESSAFRVTGDADYVAAYGIKGSVTGYTVNYQDASGKELAPSRTYYGNVGDKPVVACLYVEHYTPQALALTKTLSANEAENVFTFTYTENETEVITEPGDTVTEVVEEERPGNAENGNAGTDNNGNAGPGNAGNDNEADNDNADNGEDGEGTGDGAGTQEPDDGENGNGTTEVEDEEVPQGNQDVVDLDEEEVPKANLDLDKDVKKGLPLAAGIAIGVGAVAALTVLVIFLKKRSR